MLDFHRPDDLPVTQRSFASSGPTVWHSFPITVHDRQLSLLLQATEKTELFRQAYKHTS